MHSDLRTERNLMVFEKREHSDDDIYLAIINNNGALKFLELNSNYCAPVKQCMLQYPNKVLNTSIVNILKYHYQYGLYTVCGFLTPAIYAG